MCIYVLMDCSFDSVSILLLLHPSFTSPAVSHNTFIAFLQLLLSELYNLGWFTFYLFYRQHFISADDPKSVSQGGVCPRKTVRRDYNNLGLTFYPQALRYCKEMAV